MSIEFDIYKYISNDATLRALIGGSSSDPEIYPNIAKASSPHIVYFVHGEGSGDQIIDSIRLTFKITAPKYDYELVARIRDRLNVLLDFKQSQANLQVPSADYYIYDITKNGGSDDHDDTTLEAIKIVRYDIDYLIKSI